MPPQLSIIVPIYNAADTLKACIESVLTQPFEDFELILIDDGSTDHSHSICQQFAQTDKRITVQSQPNAGPSQSRNNGLEIAQGLYVTFLDSDDTVAPAFYPSAMAYMRSKDCDLFVVGIDRFISERDAITVNAGPIALETLYQLILETNFIGLSACNKVFRRQIITTHHITFHDVRFAEDLVFLGDFLQHTVTAAIDPRPLYHYHEQPNSITQKARHSKQISPQDLTVLEALELAETRYLKAGSGSIATTFKTRACRSALRLMLLMLQAGYADRNAYTHTHKRLRQGWTALARSRYQCWTIKVSAGLMALMPVELLRLAGLGWGRIKGIK
ncbi:glycosyltransferase [Spiribacter sp. C176]|uniref:Glycosyltransferase n=1 Tax=Spiribacter salilacus TaxID=2664894 RepID=A0A6N7QUE8_9GAMM|nr:glycosyltransferase family 2 protein [Spiribacter salilacus]MRH79029.1 glycosyltransferase [Spiribacter salilacus]